MEQRVWEAPGGLPDHGNPKHQVINQSLKWKVLEETEVQRGGRGLPQSHGQWRAALGVETGECWAPCPVLLCHLHSPLPLLFVCWPLLGVEKERGKEWRDEVKDGGGDTQTVWGLWQRKGVKRVCACTCREWPQTYFHDVIVSPRTSALYPLLLS